MAKISPGMVMKACLLFSIMVLTSEAVTVYKMLNGYNIISPVLSSRQCDTFCRRTCLMACGCEADCKSVSVNQPLQQCHLHQNVIYDEDTEFSNSSGWEYHQETTNTIKKGNWTLVFRVTPFIGQAALTTWQNSGNNDDHPANKYGVPPGCASINSSKSCDRHFRSKILDDWSTYNISEAYDGRSAKVALEKGPMGSVSNAILALLLHKPMVKLELFNNGVSQHHIIFDGTGSDVNSWMSMDKIISTTWTDLMGSSYNFFGIVGHSWRTFFINKSYNACPDDYGWMIVVDTPLGHGCDYEAVATTVPAILFSGGTNYTNLNNFVQADVMAVFVKLG